MSDFDEAYTRHVAAVVRYAWRLVGRREIAEELAADAFLSLHEHMATIDVTLLPGWLFTVVRNRAIDYWRRQTLEERYRHELLREPLATAPEPPLPLLEHKTLKPIHRVCLRLRYGYGMSVAEIARATGLSDTQVKGHLQYARQLLRRQLVKEAR